MAGVLSALAHIHGRNLIHADVKPDNIGVNFGRDGVWAKTMLLDFGNSLMQETTASTRQKQHALAGRGLQVCTLSTRAPELLAACHDFTEAIDMWSVGVVWYYWIKHCFPFDARSEQEVAAAILDALWVGNRGHTEHSLRTYYALHKRRPRQPFRTGLSNLHPLESKLMLALMAFADGGAGGFSRDD